MDPGYKFRMGPHDRACMDPCNSCMEDWGGAADWSNMAEVSDMSEG